MNEELERLARHGWIAPPLDVDGVRYAETVERSAVSYPDQGFEAFGVDGGHGYWFDHRARAVTRHIRAASISTMWEVGAGTGAMARRLRPVLSDVVAVEPLPEGARVSAAHGIASICGRLQDVALPDGGVESIGAFDVLEHLEHPGELLDEVRRVIRADGALFVTVPALPALWGDEDDVAGHFRRYTRRSLEIELRAVGFAPVRTEYLFASLVPLAALLRAVPYRLGRRRSREAVLSSLEGQLAAPQLVDRAMRGALSVEAAVSRVVPLPLGLSVVGTFRRI